MSREEASRLVEAIVHSPDAGAWHAMVAVGPGEQGYVVVVRQHNHHEMFYLRSMEEFIALLNG